VIADDFGNFNYKNLPVLEKANKDIVEKMRKEAMQAQARGYNSQAVSTSTTPVVNSPAPSLEGSPMPMPVKRALSISKGHRPQSPSGLGNLNSSPSRPSQPASPLLVQFSTMHNHERRKTSGSSHSSGSLHHSASTGFFDAASEAKASQGTASPVKHMRMHTTSSPAKAMGLPVRTGSVHGRTRSQTLGSQDGESPVARDGFAPGHHKRKSQLFASARDVSPSSSDNENAHQKALLKVQRRRQSSRRLSHFNLLDGPVYRPLDVLIVEDHPVSKMVMEKLFEKLKCRTITASNGPEALRLAVSQIQFDIIFMEFKLHLINGVDVARMIRDTKSANTTTPIVCVTGYLRDLPEVHHFDKLMQKPPTIPKLTEELCQYCNWKPPPKDFKLAAPLMIPSNPMRHDPLHGQDSPSSVASSMAPTMPESSWKGSSREDSIGSGGFFSDLESVKTDDIPLIVSRAATDDWARGGLGIDTTAGLNPPALLHTESAPVSALMGTTDQTLLSSGSDVRTPRHQRSSEAIRSKREQMEKQRLDVGGPDEGDDEDDELGHVQVRTKSPTGKTARQASKLGIEMMRTNSRGSVISMNEDKNTDGENLRKSLEILEERMESLKIPEEPELSTTTSAESTQPRKMQRVPSSNSQISPKTTLEERPGSRQGHITPPVIFPLKPGDTVKDIDMSAPSPSIGTPGPATLDSSEEHDSDITPMPTKTIDFAHVEQDTPRR
jgi:serine/threonine-protein kinase RIM15